MRSLHLKSPKMFLESIGLAVGQVLITSQALVQWMSLIKFFHQRKVAFKSKFKLKCNNYLCLSP